MRFYDDAMEFKSGRVVYVHDGHIALRTEDNGLGPQPVYQLSYGADGQISMGMFSLSERIELADYMIHAWTQWKLRYAS